MATSSTSSTAARSAALMRATLSTGASAASRRRPASACRAATTISMSACSRRSSARCSRPCARTACREGNVGIWIDTTTRWTDWLRTTVGVREDFFAGRVLERHAGKFRQCAGDDDEPEGRHRARPVVQDRILRQCRLRPAQQRYPRRDHHGRSQRQGDAARPRAAAGALARRRGRRPHQGDRGPHQLACACSCSISIPSCCSSAMPAPPSRAGRAAASASNGPTSTSPCRG